MVTARTQKRVCIDRRDIVGRKLSVRFESTGYRRDVASSLRSELFQEDFAFDEPWISSEKYTAARCSSIAAALDRKNIPRIFPTLQINIFSFFTKRSVQSDG